MRFNKTLINSEVLQDNVTEKIITIDLKKLLENDKYILDQIDKIVTSIEFNTEKINNIHGCINSCAASCSSSCIDSCSTSCSEKCTNACTSCVGGCSGSCSLLCTGTCTGTNSGLGEDSSGH